MKPKGTLVLGDWSLQCGLEEYVHGHHGDRVPRTQLSATPLRIKWALLSRGKMVFGALQCLSPYGSVHLPPRGAETIAPGRRGWITYEGGNLLQHWLLSEAL